MARSLTPLVLAAAALFAGMLSAPGATSSRAATLMQPAAYLPPSPAALGRPVPGKPAAPKPATRPAPLRYTLIDAAGASVRAWPGGRSMGTLAFTTPLGSHSWAWAVARSGRWAKIVLPWRPNGRYGWIRTTGRHTVQTAIWVDADLSRRTVTLMRGRARLRSFSAAIGAAATPTPTGRFSVTDLVATGNASGPFGWYAFGLSGHQPNLPVGWTGGTSWPSTAPTLRPPSARRPAPAAWGLSQRTRCAQALPAAGHAGHHPSLARDGAGP